MTRRKSYTLFGLYFHNGHYRCFDGKTDPARRTGEFTACSESNPLNLILGKPFLRAVVEFGRPRALVRGHFLRVFERSAIGEIGRNPGGVEGVAAGFRRGGGRLW